MNRTRKKRKGGSWREQLRERDQERHRAEGREATAWHEAAHAVCMEYFEIDKGVKFVTCDPFVYLGESYAGFCMPNGLESELEKVATLTGVYILMQLSAGFVCEWIHGTMARDYVDPGDVEEMKKVAKQFDVPWNQQIEIIFSLAENFLQFHWFVVEYVAMQLIDRGRIEGSELRTMVRSRIGYVPKANQAKSFGGLGLVVEPGSEAASREPWTPPAAMAIVTRAFDYAGGIIPAGRKSGCSKRGMITAIADLRGWPMVLPFAEK